MRRPFVLPRVWIPAFAGMTDGASLASRFARRALLSNFLGFAKGAGDLKLTRS